MALQEEMETQGSWLFKFRSTLPILLLFMGMGYYVWSEKVGDRPFDEGSKYERIYLYACIGVSLAGLVFRSYVVGHTPANTSGRNTAEGQVADTVNKTGMYSMVRHPLYVGNFIMWLGPALLSGSFWFVAAFTFIYCVYYDRIMFAEEQFLRKKFGSAYLEWANRVPAFVPDLSLYVKPSIPFSWKKVLKKEKNGLVAVFLVFYLFYALGEFAEGEKPTDNLLLYLTIMSGIIYLILKMIKSNTKWLDEEGR